MLSMTFAIRMCNCFFKEDRKSTRLNSSHRYISYAVFCLKKKHTPVSLVRHSEAQQRRGVRAQDLARGLDHRGLDAAAADGAPDPAVGPAHHTGSRGVRAR